MEILILILVPAFFGAGFFIGKAMPLRRRKVKENKLKIAEEIGKAMLCKVALTEIRENRTTNAIESLEFSLDCNVTVLWQFREKSDSIAKEHADRVLKQIKTDRQKWPRETVVRGAEYDLDAPGSRAQIEKTISEAREILKNLPG